MSYVRITVARVIRAPTLRVLELVLGTYPAAMGGWGES